MKRLAVAPLALALLSTPLAAMTLLIARNAAAGAGRARTAAAEREAELTID